MKKFNIFLLFSGLIIFSLTDVKAACNPSECGDGVHECSSNQQCSAKCCVDPGSGSQGPVGGINHCEGIPGTSWTGVPGTDSWLCCAPGTTIVQNGIQEVTEVHQAGTGPYFPCGPYTAPLSTNQISSDGETVTVRYVCPLYACPAVPVCANLTAPSSSSFNGTTGTAAQLAWIPGNKGTQELVRIGTGLTEVNYGCYGTTSDTPCFASYNFPSYSFPANWTTPQQMFFFSKSNNSCTYPDGSPIMTSSSYTDIATCNANLTQYIPDSTGICYKTLNDCQIYNTTSFVSAGQMQSGSKYYARVVNYDTVNGCYLDEVRSLITPASCNVSISAAPSLVSGGGSGTLTATPYNVRQFNGVTTGSEVSYVKFRPNDSNVVTVNPSDIATSPYTTTISPAGVGTTAVNADVYVDGALTCTVSTNVTVAAPPAEISTCSISILSQNGNSGLVRYTGHVSSSAPNQSVRFWIEKYDRSSITGLTSSDYPPQVATNNVIYYYLISDCAANSGASCAKDVTINAPVGDYYLHCDVPEDPGKCSGNPDCTYKGGSVDCTGWQQCSNSDLISYTVAAPVASCDGVVFSSPSAPIPVEATGTAVATVTNTQNGTVDDVTFSSSDTGVLIITGTNPDYSATYSTQVKGVAVGTATLMGTAHLSSGTTCTGTRSVDVIKSDPWWQVKDGDVTANGDLASLVPDTMYFDDMGAGGYPGVPVYSGAFNLSSSIDKISTTKWDANTTSTVARLFDYSYFENLIPADVTPTVATNNSLKSTGFKEAGDSYEWFKVTGNLDINSAIDFGSRKVILFVESGNLNVNAKINVTNDSGFFAVFVNGNINVSPSLTDAANPVMEGLYEADGTFNTGTSGAGLDSRLHVRGSVAALGQGINLQRDLTNNTNPAELFEFAPDQILMFPDKLGYRKQKWTEVAP